MRLTNSLYKNFGSAKVSQFGLIALVFLLNMSHSQATPPSGGFFDGISKPILDFASVPTAENLLHIPASERDGILGGLYTLSSVEAGILGREPSAATLRQLYTDLSRKVGDLNQERFAIGGLSELMRNPDAIYLSSSTRGAIVSSLFDLVGANNSQMTHRLFCESLRETDLLDQPNPTQSIPNLQKDLIVQIVHRYGSVLGGFCPVAVNGRLRSRDIRPFLNAVQPGLSVYITADLDQNGVFIQRDSLAPSMSSPVGSPRKDSTECTEIKFRCAVQKQFVNFSGSKSHIYLFNLESMNCFIPGRIEKDVHGKLIYSREQAKFIETAQDRFPISNLEDWIRLLKSQGLVKESTQQEKNNPNCPERRSVAVPSGIGNFDHNPDAVQ